MSEGPFFELVCGKGAHANPLACVEDLPPYPNHPALRWPTEAAPPSEKQWSDAKSKFSALLQKLSTLGQSPPDVLAREGKATHPGHTKIASCLQPVPWQTLVHISYHTGQIAVMRCCLGAWPPRGGGDSW